MSLLIQSHQANVMTALGSNTIPVICTDQVNTATAPTHSIRPTTAATSSSAASDLLSFESWEHHAPSIASVDTASTLSESVAVPAPPDNDNANRSEAAANPTMMMPLMNHPPQTIISKSPGVSDRKNTATEAVEHEHNVETNANVCVNVSGVPYKIPVSAFGKLASLPWKWIPDPPRIEAAAESALRTTITTTTVPNKTPAMIQYRSVTIRLNGEYQLQTTPFLFEILLNHVLFGSLPDVRLIRDADLEELEPMILLCQMTLMEKHLAGEGDHSGNGTGGGLKCLRSLMTRSCSGGCSTKLLAHQSSSSSSSSSFRRLQEKRQQQQQQVMKRIIVDRDDDGAHAKAGNDDERQDCASHFDRSIARNSESREKQVDNNVVDSNSRNHPVQRHHNNDRAMTTKTATQHRLADTKLPLTSNTVEPNEHPFLAREKKKHPAEASRGGVGRWHKLRTSLSSRMMTGGGSQRSLSLSKAEMEEYLD